MNASLRLGLVGPLPPPPGGMANQTRQLATLLGEQGVEVRVVRTNEPVRPAWVSSLRGVRGAFRLVPYLIRLGAVSRDCDVMHVMANSGWAWHLCAAPAIAIGAARGIPVVVNYRGGLAREFLRKSARSVLVTLRRAGAVVVPSRFLQEVFGEFGVHAEIIPNIVNVDTFRPGPDARLGGAHVVVTRNLEHLYGIDVAIRAAGILAAEFPDLTLSIAGTGRERASLERLVERLGLGTVVRFTGALDVEAIAKLYRQADVMLNPSRADNTPNAILEAAASALPVVSTRVGGIPYLVEHGRSAWLVPTEDPQAMADGLRHVLRDAEVRSTLRENGLTLARDCSWDTVRSQWLELYWRVAQQRVARRRTVLHVGK